jgi:hypothetical protein
MVNIKIGLKEIEWKGVEWLHLAQDEVQGRGKEPSGFIKCSGFLYYLSDT